MLRQNSTYPENGGITFLRNLRAYLSSTGRHSPIHNLVVVVYVRSKRITIFKVAWNAFLYSFLEYVTC